MEKYVFGMKGGQSEDNTAAASQNHAIEVTSREKIIIYIIKLSLVGREKDAIIRVKIICFVSKVTKEMVREEHNPRRDRTKLMEVPWSEEDYIDGYEGSELCAHDDG